ncbi:hypothetical protein A2U01_0051574 [Trifolium medium]|uniref:Uncharacterized protein n=1 Tax=Trifolium medium TaxID=97028 RepID=A0A392R487_9FABA|nr:hypothetical protein [Trifolium medium]
MLLLLNHHPQFEKDLMKNRLLEHLYQKMDIQVLCNFRLQKLSTNGLNRRILRFR